MTEDLKKFLLAVAADKEWIQWVNALAGRQEAVAAAVEKAAELGLNLSPTDFEEPEGALSEEELAGVAGGACSCTLSGTGLSPAKPERPEIPEPEFPFFLEYTTEGGPGSTLFQA